MILVTITIICAYLKYKKREVADIIYFYKEDITHAFSIVNIQNNYAEFGNYVDLSELEWTQEISGVGFRNFARFFILQEDSI